MIWWLLLLALLPRCFHGAMVVVDPNLRSGHQAATFKYSSRLHDYDSAGDASTLVETIVPPPPGFAAMYAAQNREAPPVFALPDVGGVPKFRKVVRKSSGKKREVISAASRMTDDINLVLDPDELHPPHKRHKPHKHQQVKTSVTKTVQIVMGKAKEGTKPMNPFLKMNVNELLPSPQPLVPPQLELPKKRKRLLLKRLSSQNDLVKLQKVSSNDEWSRPQSGLPKHKKQLVLPPYTDKWIPLVPTYTSLKPAQKLPAPNKRHVAGEKDHSILLVKDPYDDQSSLEEGLSDDYEPTLIPPIVSPSPPLPPDAQIGPKSPPKSAQDQRRQQQFVRQNRPSVPRRPNPPPKTTLKQKVQSPAEAQPERLTLVRRPTPPWRPTPARRPNRPPKVPSTTTPTPIPTTTSTMNYDQNMLAAAKFEFVRFPSHEELEADLNANTGGFDAVTADLQQKLRGLKSNFDDFQNTYRPPIKDLRFTTTAAATATAAKYNPQVLPRSLKARSDLSDLPEFPSFPREDLRERRRQGQNVGSTFRFSSAAEPSVRAALTLAGDDVKKLYVRDPYHSVTATATVTASPDVQGHPGNAILRHISTYSRSLPLHGHSGVQGHGRQDVVDYGAATGSGGSFGWYSDHPVRLS